jgi:hypothetical protein
MSRLFLSRNMEDGNGAAGVLAAVGGRGARDAVRDVRPRRRRAPRRHGMARVHGGPPSPLLRLPPPKGGSAAHLRSRAAAVASFSAAVLTGIYLGKVCSCQEILRRNGRGQAPLSLRRHDMAWLSRPPPPRAAAFRGQEPPARRRRRRHRARGGQGGGQAGRRRPGGGGQLLLREVATHNVTKS